MYISLPPKMVIHKHEVIFLLLITRQDVMSLLKKLHYYSSKMKLKIENISQTRQVVLIHMYVII